MRAPGLLAQPQQKARRQCGGQPAPCQCRRVVAEHRQPGLERRDLVVAQAGLRPFLLGVAYNLLRRHFEKRMGPRGRVDPMTTSLGQIDGRSPPSVLSLARATGFPFASPVKMQMVAFREGRDGRLWSAPHPVVSLPDSEDNFQIFSSLRTLAAYTALRIMMRRALGQPDD